MIRTTRNCDGFTLMELIVVMVMVGVLATVAVPRFFSSSDFDDRGFYDAVKAAAQHARRTAIASRRFTCVNLTAGTGTSAVVSLRIDTTVPESVVTVGCTGAGGSALNLPATASGCSSANQICGTHSVTLAGSSLIFDPLGRLVDSSKNVLGSAATITVSTRTISVQPETGFVQ